MESAGLRQAYGLVPPRKGVLVRSIWPTSPVSREVRPDDIIMRFDGVDIACDGTVPFRRARTSRAANTASCPLPKSMLPCGAVASIANRLSVGLEPATKQFGLLVAWRGCCLCEDCCQFHSKP